MRERCCNERMGPVGFVPMVRALGGPFLLSRQTEAYGGHLALVRPPAWRLRQLEDSQNRPPCAARVEASAHVPSVPSAPAPKGGRLPSTFAICARQVL